MRWSIAIVVAGCAGPPAPVARLPAAPIVAPTCTELLTVTGDPDALPAGLRRARGFEEGGEWKRAEQELVRAFEPLAKDAQLDCLMTVIALDPTLAPDRSYDFLAGLFGLQYAADVMPMLAAHYERAGRVDDAAAARTLARDRVKHLAPRKSS